MMRMEEREVEKFIRKHGMVEKGDVVIAGVSGGADSVCLLFVLFALQEELGFRIKVCHVNHGLRGAGADADEEYVRRLCGELGVPCRFFRENVELIARKRKQSPEEAGRAVRRNAFLTMCREDGGTRIATAHHRDDNAETMILNMARGTGLKGLGGIRPVTGRWIRPLLTLTREETERYLKERGVSWCDDATNSGDEYTRNRIRHNVLPMLEEQVNRRTAEHLDELSRQAQEIWDYLERGVDLAWKKCVKAGESARTEGRREEKSRETRTLEIDKKRLEQEPPAVRTQLLRRCLACVRGQERDIGAVHVRAVEELFGKQAGRKLELPGGMQAERTYAGVRIGRKGKNSGDYAVPLCVPGETVIPETGQRVVCRFLENTDVLSAEAIPQKSYTKQFDYDIIKYGLSARTRQSGDYFILDDSGRRQKLKSFFVNNKIPQEERDRMLIIADGSHIIWVPGYRMSRAYHVTSRTDKILEIKITEEAENVRDNQGFDPRGKG